MMQRRGFLAALGAILAAPAIIRTPGLLMPVKAQIPWHLTIPIGSVGHMPGGGFAMWVAHGEIIPCDGSQLHRSQYPELFAALGHTYGGLGEAFRLPDLRGQTHIPIQGLTA